MSTDAVLGLAVDAPELSTPTPAEVFDAYRGAM